MVIEHCTDTEKGEVIIEVDVDLYYRGATRHSPAEYGDVEIQKITFYDAETEQTHEVDTLAEAFEMAGLKPDYKSEEDIELEAHEKAEHAARNRW